MFPWLFWVQRIYNSPFTMFFCLCTKQRIRSWNELNINNDNSIHSMPNRAWGELVMSDIWSEMLDNEIFWLWEHIMSIVTDYPNKSSCLLFIEFVMREIIAPENKFYPWIIMWSYSSKKLYFSKISVNQLLHKQLNIKKVTCWSGYNILS